MGHHLVDGEFQSDKYPWCKRGFVPLKLTDPDARAVLNEYARRRLKRDPEFSSDLWQAIRIQEGKSQTGQKITIFLNGVKKGVARRTLSYAEIVDISGIYGADLYTVAYTHADQLSKTSGTLTPGESVRIQEGTRIDVADTSNA